MEAFLAKKRTVAPATTSKQTASETESGVKVGSPICTPGPNSYADVLSAPCIGTSTSDMDVDTQVQANTCSPLPSPQSSVSDESPVKSSPVATRTRSKVSSQCKEPRIDFKQQVARMSTSPVSLQT